jgi:hypothetical protein
MRRCRFLVGAPSALACFAAAADEPWDGERRGAYFGVSRLRPEADPQLSGQDGKWGFAVGFGRRYSRHVALELELLYTGQEAGMPALLRLEADFGPEFGGGTKIGGGMPMLAYRFGLR